MTAWERVWRSASSAALIAFGVLVATKVDRLTFNAAFAANAYIILPLATVFLLGVVTVWIARLATNLQWHRTIKHHMGDIYRQNLDERDERIAELEAEVAELETVSESYRGRIRAGLSGLAEPLEEVVRRRAK